MNTLPTMLFPDTDVYRDTIYPVLLFCTPLRFLQPVKSGTGQGENDTDLFMENGLCQAYTPAPISEDERERFLRLIHDIKTRKDDYSAQLSALTVANLSDPAARQSDGFRTQIMSSLLSRDSATEEESVSRAELWQARLILAIGTILDQEEEELLQNMNLLDVTELQMLQKLQGDESSESEELLQGLQQVRANLENPRPRDARMRFQAWLRVMSYREAPEVDLWLASSRDAADEIFNRLDSKNQVPIPVLKLALPGEIGVSPVHLINQVLDFHAASTALHHSIKNDLYNLCQSEITAPIPTELLLPGHGNYIESWEGLVEEHFPRGSHGRAFLTFYLLPETPVSELLSLQAAAEPLRHGLLAVLHRESVR